MLLYELCCLYALIYVKKKYYKNFVNSRESHSQYPLTDVDLTYLRPYPTYRIYATNMAIYKGHSH